MSERGLSPAFLRLHSLMEELRGALARHENPPAGPGAPAAMAERIKRITWFHAADIVMDMQTRLWEIAYWTHTRGDDSPFALADDKEEVFFDLAWDMVFPDGGLTDVDDLARVFNGPRWDRSDPERGVSPFELPTLAACELALSFAPERVEPATPHGSLESDAPGVAAHGVCEVEVEVEEVEVEEPDVEVDRAAPAAFEAPARIDFAALASALRRGVDLNGSRVGRGKGLPAALVEHMADKEESRIEAVIDRVYGHDAETGGKTFQQMVKRTNEALAELGSPLLFRVSCGVVSRSTVGKNPDVAEM